MEGPVHIADIISAISDPEFQLHYQNLQAKAAEKELIGEKPEVVRQWYRQELRELFDWFEVNCQRWTVTDLEDGQD